MKKLLFVLITIFFTTAGYSQNVQEIDKTNDEMAEVYFKNFESKLLKVDPDITFDENQKTRIIRTLKKKTAEIKDAISKGLTKSDWISTNKKIDKKYENEIVQQLNIKQKRAYQEAFVK